MLKESENPPIIWPEEDSICLFEGRWRVAHTKSRNEKAVAHKLIDKNIAYFLPMSWKAHRVRGQKVKALLPIFPGYLFFCGDEEDRVEVLRTNRVASIIETTNQQKLIEELVQIEQALKSGASLEPHKQLEQGQRCRIVAGPLSDIEGTVLKTQSGARLILKIEMLGQAASTEIDLDNVEVIE